MSQASRNHTPNPSSAKLPPKAIWPLPDEPRSRVIDALIERQSSHDHDRAIESARSISSRWIIYELTERESGRKYVGVTHRPLPVRIRAHLSQARRCNSVRPDGLMAALRRMMAAGKTFAEAFVARIVDYAGNAKEARQRELLWIEILDAGKPVGLNDMPGGSLGGPANSEPVAIEIAHGITVNYTSLSEAIGARNDSLTAAGKPVVEAGTVYARLGLGWSPEEALGYREHVDGRSQRPLFTFDGKGYTSLKRAADDAGIGIDTLRSRLHRARKAWLLGVPEIGGDRRQNGQGRAALPALDIPWPGTKEGLTAAQFGQRTNVPKATILHRWRRLQDEIVQRSADGSPPLTARELHELLTAPPMDRTKPVELQLPDGRVWSGGEREVIRRVLAHQALEASRVEHLSEPGIRRRLRKLVGAARRDPLLVRRAFGFSSD